MNNISKLMEFDYKCYIPVTNNDKDIDEKAYSDTILDQYKIINNKINVELNKIRDDVNKANQDLIAFKFNPFNRLRLENLHSQLAKSHHEPFYTLWNDIHDRIFETISDILHKIKQRNIEIKMITTDQIITADYDDIENKQQENEMTYSEETQYLQNITLSLSSFPEELKQAIDVLLTETKNYLSKNGDINNDIIELNTMLVVIICVGEYKSPSLKTLNGTIIDKQRLSQLFKTYYNYTIIANKTPFVTAQDVEDILSTAKTQLRDEQYDGVIMFYSGHASLHHLRLSNFKKNTDKQDGIYPRIRMEEYFNGFHTENKYKFYFIHSCDDYRNINTTIQQSHILPYLLTPTSIKSDEVEIKLWIKDAPTRKSKSFYIYEIGRENDDPVAQISMRKGQNEEVEDLDLDEISDKSSFSIALYEKEHDTKPISNKLHLSIPEQNEMKNIDDNYKPNAISISSVKAIESKDNNDDDNIYVYFDIPENLRGDEIAFKIKYIDDGEGKSSDDDIENPLILSKSSIPISFQIITEIIINEEKFSSEPSKTITVGYDNNDNHNQQIKNKKKRKYQEKVVKKEIKKENPQHLIYGNGDGWNKLIMISNHSKNYSGYEAPFNKLSDNIDWNKLKGQEKYDVNGENMCGILMNAAFHGFAWNVINGYKINFANIQDKMKEKLCDKEELNSNSKREALMDIDESGNLQNANKQRIMFGRSELHIDLCIKPDEKMNFQCV